MRDGERLKKNLVELGYDATNLLSCMALDVENLHSVVHHKSEVSTALQYARHFGSTAKESLKRTTAWSAYYYTSRGSWYAVPERSLGLFEIPWMSQTSAVKASKDEISMSKSAWIFCTAKKCAARNCHGKGSNSVRQAFCTKRKSKLEKESSFLQTVWQPQTSAQYPASLMQKTKVTEYDSSSYGEICEAEDLVEEGASDLGNQQITRHVHFLVGVTSRFGRPVRVHGRFVL